MEPYKVIATREHHPELGEYCGYGIAAPGCGVCVADISTDRTAVCALAERFTRFGLDPVQLLCAVEDALGGGAGALL